MQNDILFLEQLNKGWCTLQQMKQLEYHYHPRQCVFECGNVKLYRYSAHKKSKNNVPLLLVYATINRPEILELQQSQSLIGGLLEKNIDVYLLDWGYRNNNEKQFSLSDYIIQHLHPCINYIQKKSTQEKINLLGVCQGGVISLCYTNLFQENINRLILISTPIDFHTKNNKITKLVHQLNTNLFQNINVPGHFITYFFISLRLFELSFKKYLNFIDHLDDQEKTLQFLQVEKWLHDAPDQSGLALSEFIRDFYQENKLIKNEIMIAGQSIDLKSFRLPILNIVATDDEIVPASASRALKKYIDKQYYHERSFPSGHIGIYISNKVGSRLSKSIVRWLNC
ncbi:MAG: hypothetical protein A3F12_01340 [Gammaproteobacteria bacterium RIFCSPHIGHO2_12_FULL_38_14]|nr:MAG: hypothetical protein A3F12_01340 [Gammaproteobacteria bacterium RIFCSPHIGHO2_12_FULL_38_14]